MLQVLLAPPRPLLEARLLERAASGGHFTPGTALLDSQLAALQYEEAELLLHVRGVGGGAGPDEAPSFPPPDDVVAAVLRRLGGAGGA